MIRNVIIICCFLFCNVMHADPIADVYQIEVIVFEHMDANRFKAEHWPKFVAKLNTNNAINLNTLKKNVPESLDTMDVLDALDETGHKPLNKVIKESVTLVEPKNYLLNNEERMIKNSKVQRLIKHIAWMQPLAINVKSTPVYFYAGKENDPEINALLTIKPGRNISNVYIDLNYKIQPEDKKDDPGVEEIKLTRDLKVKKKEVYYVDHPVIGMLIIMSPIVLGTNSYSPLPNQ